MTQRSAEDEARSPDRRAGVHSQATSQWRAVWALVWRWVLRAVVGYVAMVALLLIGSSLLQPDMDWSRAGGLASLLAAYAFWIVVISPFLALIGVAEAVAIWLALRVSQGSVKTGAATAGIGGGGLCIAFNLYSDPRLPDLLAGLALSTGIGAIAAWVTLRDVSRVRSLTDWLARLRQGRRQGAA